MSGVNKVILIGNLGKDPETRSFEGGNMTTRFTLATNEVYRDKNGNRAESTEWHNIAMWGKLAEIAGKLLHKGSQIYVEGKLRNRSWEDKEGNKRYITEVVADNFTLLDKKPATGGADADYSTSLAQGASGESAEPGIDDDLPF